MNRSLVFLGAFALAVAQSAAMLGAHPASLAPARPGAPAPHPIARGGFTNQGDVKVPFHVNVLPLMERPDFTLHSAGFSPQVLVSPFRRYRWQSPLGYLWSPGFYGPACYAANNFLNAPVEQLPSDLSIGSLVDGKSNILSPLSYSAGYAMGNDPGAATSNPFALQVGFYPMACGAPSFTKL